MLSIKYSKGSADVLMTLDEVDWLPITECTRSSMTFTMPVDAEGLSFSSAANSVSMRIMGLLLTLKSSKEDLKDKSLSYSESSSAVVSSSLVVFMVGCLVCDCLIG